MWMHCVAFPSRVRGVRLGAWAAVIHRCCCVVSSGLALTPRVKNWGSSYSIQVDIGTPPQSLDTFIDTGSADLWVIGSCHDETECGMSKLFNTAQSSTYRDTGRVFEIRYLKGETLGTTGEDVVSVGGDGIRTMFGEPSTDGHRGEGRI